MKLLLLLSGLVVRGAAAWPTCRVPAATGDAPSDAGWPGSRGGQAYAVPT